MTDTPKAINVGVNAVINPVVYIVIRTDNERRNTLHPVTVRTVKGIFADFDKAKNSIPEWATQERTTLRNNELFATGAENIEFTVEQWVVIL